MNLFLENVRYIVKNKFIENKSSVPTRELKLIFYYVTYRMELLKFHVYLSINYISKLIIDNNINGNYLSREIIKKNYRALN